MVPFSIGPWCHILIGFGFDRLYDLQPKGYIMAGVWEELWAGH